jgi:virginiamycin A acetyltransferase
VVRRRYDDEDVERLLRAAWWDWPVELVTEHARTIMSGEPADLKRIADGARAE